MGESIKTFIKAAPGMYIQEFSWSFGVTAHWLTLNKMADNTNDHVYACMN